MAIEVRPATVFVDVAGDGRAQAARRERVLVPELPAHVVERERALKGTARGERVPRAGRPRSAARASSPMTATRSSGWAGVHPRADTSFATNRKIPHVDDLDVWSVWCIRVRPGHRGEGISHHLLAGAVEFARDHGAPAIEGYPLDNQGEKIDLTMAYVGTMSLFEQAGFTKAADTDSVLNGFPRVLMRLDLT